MFDIWFLAFSVFACETIKIGQSNKASKKTRFRKWRLYNCQGPFKFWGMSKDNDPKFLLLEKRVWRVVTRKLTKGKQVPLPVKFLDRAFLEFIWRSSDKGEELYGLGCSVSRLSLRVCVPLTKTAPLWAAIMWIWQGSNSKTRNFDKGFDQHYPSCPRKCKSPYKTHGRAWLKQSHIRQLVLINPIKLYPCYRTYPASASQSRQTLLIYE